MFLRLMHRLMHRLTVFIIHSPQLSPPFCPSGWCASPLPKWKCTPILARPSNIRVSLVADAQDTANVFSAQSKYS